MSPEGVTVIPSGAATDTKFRFILTVLISSILCCFKYQSKKDKADRRIYSIINKTLKYLKLKYSVQN